MRPILIAMLIALAACSSGHPNPPQPTGALIPVDPTTWEPPGGYTGNGIEPIRSR